MNWHLKFILLLLLALLGVHSNSVAEQRFPPPDFESGYKLPTSVVPPARGLIMEYLDVAVLVGCLAISSHLILKRRSRRAIMSLSIFSLAYFGFYRRGCICAIGSVQNVGLSLFDSSYALPLSVLAFFLAPIVMSLFGGRSFCAAVCPHGALQDLVLLKPIRVPPWLEHGMSVIPFIYLGAGLIFAATGSAFLICRTDPFVPLFRLSGNFLMLAAGGVLLLIGVFVGRPYCRFLCPYGAILKLTAKVSKWRVTITPDSCTQCRLCETSCPYNAIQLPELSPVTPMGMIKDRKRLSLILLLTPIILLMTGWAGSHTSLALSKVDRNVTLAERLVQEKQAPVPLGVQTAAALSLARAEQDPKALLTVALEKRSKFRTAGWAFGIWTGLVICVKLSGLSVRHRRADYEPDRGSCFGCGRCFLSCPQERVRLGLVLPETGSLIATTSSTSAPAEKGAVVKNSDSTTSHV